MRPSNKTWSLTVRRGSLHLDAPHGSFEVRGIAPEVMPVVKALPDGTDIECDGAFDGGGTITHLVVTKVRRILKDLSGRVMQLPDAVVAADPRLSAARARQHFEAGRIAKAAVDVAALLGHGDELALVEYERLPPEHRAPLFEALVAWQAQQPPTWRALRHIPLARWTDDQLAAAGEQALASGGLFGAAPGMRLEEIVGELERRKLPTKSLAKQTQRLRRAQATEGDTVHRLVTDVIQARVIGGDTTSVFVNGLVILGKAVVQKGAMRQLSEDYEGVVVHYALDGRELRRWKGLAADSVVNGVALQIDVGDPGTAVRLSDGAELFKFAHRIVQLDGEFVWGIHSRDQDKRRMRSEIRHIATGFAIAKLDTWVDSIESNGQHLFVRGDAPQTLTREGRVVAQSVPPRPATLSIESAAATHTIPVEHAPWLFDDYQSIDTGGWTVHYAWRDIYLAPSEVGATWVHLQLARGGESIELAPPWLVIRQKTAPILLVALAEAMSAQQIRVDGKAILKRAKDVPTIDVPTPLRDWYHALVEHGLLGARSDAERDALLYRASGGGLPLPDDVVARILVGGESPVALDLADYDIEEGDQVFARLSTLFANDDFAIEEIARKDLSLPDDDDEEREEQRLTLRARCAGKTLKRQCGASVSAVMTTVDKLADELGTKRRIYALDGDRRRVFVVITKAQRRALVAAGITGIRASAR